MASRKSSEETLIEHMNQYLSSPKLREEFKEDIKGFFGDKVYANASPKHTPKPVIEDKSETPTYEMVNHPDHYNTSSVETIEKMRRIWGNEQTAMWCEMTAFKYRERIGHKPDNPIEQEMKKIQWYENKAKELRDLK